MSNMASELDQVKQYYGRVLSTKRDLKTSACCTTDALPEHHRSVLELIEHEVLEKFYGCGSPLPPALDNAVVLDLGCGSGRDVYMASSLVGPKGRVIGVDMTDEQLEIARRYESSQMRRFGYLKSNVTFEQGYIEDLKSLGIEDNSVDVVISNCVINLSPDKDRVFSEIFRVLKPGGELYFSDVFTGRRVPEALRRDPVLYGECLGGAMYVEDFRRMLRKFGVLDYRVVARSRIDLQDPEVEVKAGMIDFHSLTVRAFKLDNLEDICEDYGQVATYHGSIGEAPHEFVLDDHHIFVTGKPMLVCGNTAAMLQDSRYGKYFTVHGDRSVHYGEFDCGPGTGKAAETDVSGGACC
jgi:SAM-dependent methyltransferase